MLVILVHGLHMSNKAVQPAILEASPIFFKRVLYFCSRPHLVDPAASHNLVYTLLV